MAGEATVVQIAGRRLSVTNLDKVLFPQTGTTKAEVLRYYALVAPALLPVVAGRPVTRKRWPHGVESEPFFVKNLEPGAARWIPRQIVAHSDRPVEYPMADSPAVLAWMAQMAALELHVPQWRFFEHRPGRPDRMVFDLDPGPGVGLGECARVANWVREVLQRAGSDGVPVTSGSKGLHLYVPLDSSRTSDEVSATARTVAQALENEHPRSVTSKMAKSVRPGKVFIDWSQNNGAKTTIAPYSLRGRAEPMVAAPREWGELDDEITQLNFQQVLDRLADGMDPWREMFPPDPDDDDDGAGDAADLDDVAGAGSDQDGDVGTGDGIETGHGVGPAVPAGPSEDARAGAAAYAVAAMGGSYGEKKHGQHRWEDPLEGPRGRVVRREFGKKAEPDRDSVTPGTGVGGRTRLAGGPSGSGLLPMSATSGQAADLADPEQWRFEGKWDGIRALAEVGDGAVRLIGRSGRELTSGYPELAELGELLAGHSAVLDGEIVALEPDGRSSFPLLQRRMNLAAPALITRAVRDVPVQYFVFDLLQIDGVSLLGKTYDVRRQLLSALQLAGEAVDVPARLDGDLAEALRYTKEQNWEGVVAKRGDSVYRPGIRSGHWLKLKNQRTQEVVVIGWRPGGGRRSGGIGSLLVAVGDETSPGLRYAGRVGTGFTDAVLADLADRVGARTADPAAPVPAADARDAVWVEPVLVGEVSFTEWTPDGKLRAPSWRGLRPDKSVAEVRVES